MSGRAGDKIACPGCGADLVLRVMRAKQGRTAAYIKHFCGDGGSMQVQIWHPPPAAPEATTAPHGEQKGAAAPANLPAKPPRSARRRPKDLEDLDKQIAKRETKRK